MLSRYNCTNRNVFFTFDAISKNPALIFTTRSFSCTLENVGRVFVAWYNLVCFPVFFCISNFFGNTYTQQVVHSLNTGYGREVKYPAQKSNMINKSLFRKKEVFAQLFALEKWFKICYVYVKKKTQVVFFVLRILSNYLGFLFT